MNRRLVVIGVLFLLLAPPARAQSSPAPPPAQAAPNTSPIRATVAGFADAWNRHDMAAFGRLFAPDADFVNVSATWWKGRDEIQLRHAYSHGTLSQAEAAKLDPGLRHYGLFARSTMAFPSITVRLARPDLAIAHVSWRLMGDARTAEARTGMLTFVLVPAEGKWQIVAAQNTEIHRVVH